MVHSLKREEEQHFNIFKRHGAVGVHSAQRTINIKMIMIMGAYGNSPKHKNAQSFCVSCFANGN
jgi:hypothetical protein